MRKKLPGHGERRTRYPFSLLRRIIEGHLVWFECYKLIEIYHAGDHQWNTEYRLLDDRANYVNKKEEVRTLGGPY